MTMYTLSSEYDRLTSEQQDRVTHIIADDGEWTEEMITSAMEFKLLRTQVLKNEDWTG
jgi:hypothetical protein